VVVLGVVTAGVVVARQDGTGAESGGGSSTGAVTAAEQRSPGDLPTVAAAPNARGDRSGEASSEGGDTSGDTSGDDSGDKGGDKGDKRADVDEALRRLPGFRAEAQRPRAEPVPLSRASSASPDVSVRVTELEWVRGKTLIPGEAGGSSLRVTITATNSGERPVRLSGSVANLYSGPDLAPSDFLLEPGSSPFPDRIGPGRSVEGVFVFTLPKRPGIPILVEADLDDGLKIVYFEGRPRDKV
jgi:hypothetical protein